jgi:hypothetical protein
MDPPEYCPGCEQDVPLSHFSAQPGEDMPAGPFVCRTCREEKRQPKDLLPTLPVKYRKMLRAMMTSDSVGEAARKCGVSVENLRNLINGRGGETAEMVSVAWRRLLEIEGLDLATVARVGRNLLHAMEPKWNPKREDFDWFPDNTTRAKMFAHMTRQHGVDPRDNSGQFKPAVSVTINHNLADEGSRPVESGVQGAYTLEVPATSEPVEVQK